MNPPPYHLQEVIRTVIRLSHAVELEDAAIREHHGIGDQIGMGDSGLYGYVRAPRPAMAQLEGYLRACSNETIAKLLTLMLQGKAKIKGSGIPSVNNPRDPKETAICELLGSARLAQYLEIGSKES